MQSGESTDRSLAGLWAKKYVRSLAGNKKTASTEAPPGSDRAQTAIKLVSTLRFCSSRAWAKTEELLFKNLQKHRINASLIDPWKIAEDSRSLFERAVESYQENITPERFSVSISKQCGRVRQAHTAVDPRVLGFLSMQFHYTGQFLLEELDESERAGIADYFKVMDDHLYMPLQRSYEAAAQQDFRAPVLIAVQQLLPISTTIAESIATDVAKRNAQHLCYTGPLHHPLVRVSTIRDIEMFQIYLCLCVLEGSIASVQQELFPLCVMLYPPLNVDWSLVRQLVQGLSQEIQTRLLPESFLIFAPYLKAFQDMFSEVVFPENDPIWGQHPDAVRFMDMARNILQEALAQPKSV